MRSLVGDTWCSMVTVSRRVNNHGEHLWPSARAMSEPPSELWRDREPPGEWYTAAAGKLVSISQCVEQQVIELRCPDSSCEFLFDDVFSSLSTLTSVIYVLFSADSDRHPAMPAVTSYHSLILEPRVLGQWVLWKWPCDLVLNTGFRW